MRDDGIVAEVRSLNGTASSLLDDDELMRATPPALRPDFQAAETYQRFAPPRTYAPPAFIPDGNGRDLIPLTVLEGVAGCLARCADLAVVCDGLAALVAVPGGGGCRWEQAILVEGRDFSLWIRQASKPRVGPGCGGAVAAEGADRRRRPQSRREELAGGVPGQVSPVTGKPSPGWGYTPRTVNHSETVLRTLYDFHREAGCGPMGPVH